MVTNNLFRACWNLRWASHRHVRVGIYQGVLHAIQSLNLSNQSENCTTASWFCDKQDVSIDVLNLFTTK